MLYDGKFVKTEDIIKRYLFHAEEQASREISQILNEVKKYDVPTVEVIPKDNVYKAIQEIIKYEHEGFINISLARFDEILKKCGVSEDGNNN